MARVVLPPPPYNTEGGNAVAAGVKTVLSSAAYGEEILAVLLVPNENI